MIGKIFKFIIKNRAWIIPVAVQSYQFINRKIKNYGTKRKERISHSESGERNG